jgi:hypothetical protein
MCLMSNVMNMDSRRYCSVLTSAFQHQQLLKFRDIFKSFSNVFQIQLWDMQAKFILSMGQSSVEIRYLLYPSNKLGKIK